MRQHRCLDFEHTARGEKSADTGEDLGPQAQAVERRAGTPVGVARRV